MPKGIGITPEQRAYIILHHETKFIKQMARDLGLHAHAVKRVITIYTQ